MTKTVALLSVRQQRAPRRTPRDSEGATITGPLEGVRVLDLTQGITGPATTKLLSDYGADVLKVERPDGGDTARRIGPFPGDEPHMERGGVYLDLNTGKRSVTLNLKTASGRGILLRLAAGGDLVIESFRAGTLERLGIGPDELREAAPGGGAGAHLELRAVRATRRDFDGDDMLMYAAGGVLQITGNLEKGPVKMGLYAPLMLVGSVAAAMTLGVLRASQRDGEQEVLDLAIHEVLAGSMDRGGVNLVSYQYSGDLMVERQPAETRRNALPNGVFPCADGYVQITTQAQWFPRFCATVGRMDLLEDERIMANLNEYEPVGGEIDAIFYPFALSHTKQELMELGQANGWPVSALNTMGDVFRDPAMRERDFFVTLDHPSAGPFEYPLPPLRFGDTPGELRRAPLLGEHTVEVLTEQLGYSKEDVVVLRQRGVV